MIRRSVVALAALLLIGCFEDPVSEEVELSIREDGEVAVAVHVRFREPGGAGAPLKRRLDEERAALQGGYDDWSKRFAAVAPDEESVTFHNRNGRLVAVEHRASLTFDQVEHFFSGSGISVRFAREPAGARRTDELSIQTARDPRGTREDERLVASALDSWSAAAAAYLAALQPFYRYMDQNRERAPAMFAKVFDSALESEEPELSDDEKALAARVDEAINEMTTIFRAGDDDVFTLQERSARVYDPFPAGLVIRLPGQVLEREGFGGSGGELRVRRTTLWDAFEGLEGRFASPDPFVTLVRFHRTPADRRETIDPARYSELPRRVTLVSPPEVKRAVEERLRPPSYYRARWRDPTHREQ